MRKSIDKLMNDTNYRKMYLSYRHSQGDYNDNIPFTIGDNG